MNSLLFSFVEISNNLVEVLNSGLGIWYLIIVNIFGVIAILAKVSEFQLKSRKGIFFLAIISFVCWTLYFILQGDFVSGLINIVCVVELIVFLQREKYKWANKKWLLVLFLAIQLTLGILTFKVWHDVFAILAGIFTTFSYFVLSKKTYRILSVFNMSFWVANSISKTYLFALINDTFGLLSVLIAILRFYILKKPNKKGEQQFVSIEKGTDNF